MKDLAEAWYSDVDFKVLWVQTLKQVQGDVKRVQGAAKQVQGAAKQVQSDAKQVRDVAKRVCNKSKKKYFNSFLRLS